MSSTTSSLSAEDYAALERDSWIDSITADAFRLSRVTSADGAELVGRTAREDYSGIVFPMYGPGDAQPREYVLRRDHPPLEQHNGKQTPKGKYLAAPGRRNRLLFGPGESVDALTDPALSIVLVEGVKKTLAAWRLSRHEDGTPQFLACGITGVWGWRGTIGKTVDATGTRVDIKGVIADMDRIIWTGRAVTILFDSDTATNDKVTAARRGLVADLRQRGARVVAPDLPTLDGFEKVGLDDLLAQWGPARVTDWLDTAAFEAPTADEAEIARLASMSTLEYAKARNAAAQKLGIGLGYLDAAVHGQRKQDASDDGQGTVITFEEIPPASEPVDGADLADRLAQLFKRFVVLPDHGEVVLVLWTFFTYCLDGFHIAPRLDLASPEKRCGKTTLLSLLRRVTFHAVLASGISPSAIFRVIDAHKPTLLIDEMDTFIEANEELRGILNSGHTRDGASIIRCEGDAHEPKLFSTWAAYAFAHIGSIPGTLEDRSIRVPMRRKLPGEQVASLRQTGPARAALQAELDTLVRQLARWIEDHTAQLARTNPLPLAGLDDRAMDNWMPLLSIAETLGGPWPERATQAALALSGQGAIDHESIKVELLRDIHSVYHDTGHERLASTELCDLLAQLEERPWGTWKKGQPITPVQLAKLLRPFTVSSATIRFEGQGTAKGYHRHAFADAFERYIPSLAQESPPPPGNSVTSYAQSSESSLFQSGTEASCDVAPTGLSPMPRAECDGVTFQKQEIQAEKTVCENADARNAFDVGAP